MLALNIKKTCGELTSGRSFAHRGIGPAANISVKDTPVLIREAQRGNPTAFEELVRQHHKAVLRLALRLTGSEHDAQDVCQEAFLSAYQNLARFRFGCSFYTWMYRIVTNRCLDHLRKRRSLQETSNSRACMESGPSDLISRVADDRHATDPESALAACELRARIAGALETLSPCERTVFELNHYQGLKLRKVAIVLNTSESNARHALFRARQKLRSALAELR